MKLLDSIDNPADLRRMPPGDLAQIASELRDEVIATVASVGGHFASTLGAVELTIALHYSFDSPNDRIVWDTGHQGYAHKVLCERRRRLATIRQFGGLSGFLSREESVYDVFGAGHAGTSVSAALGMVEANAHTGAARKVVAVMSDGGLTSGLMFEGLNQAGHLGRDLIVVLNDNAMFIDPRVGAVSSFLSKQLTTDLGVRIQRNLANILKNLPKGDELYHVARRVKDSFIGLVTPGLLFEALGFQYVGPVDGHDVGELVQTFQNVKKLERPVLVHVLTKKGRGYAPAEADPVRYHSVTPFDVATGKAKQSKGTVPTFTQVFSDALIEEAEQNERIVAITAAMGSGTGIDKFSQRFPSRAYDVGIAEQHAVTFAAGLATEGLVPVVTIYSTFLQRAYDQILHDVCLQNLHVVFALDRAGLVGADGPTHHGTFDFAYLRHIPNMVVMAPRDESELRHMLKTAADYEGPIALRYPRGEACGVPLVGEARVIEIGKAEVLRAGRDLVIAAIGATVGPAIEAAEELAQQGVDCTVVNARFVKPLDTELFVRLLSDVPWLITVEDHMLQGGFGSALLEQMAAAGLSGVSTRCLGLPDRFVTHGTQAELRTLCGIDARSIVEAGLGINRQVAGEIRKGEVTRLSGEGHVAAG